MPFQPKYIPPQTPKPQGYVYPVPVVKFELPPTTQKPVVVTYLPPTTPAVSINFSCRRNEQMRRM